MQTWAGEEFTGVGVAGGILSAVMKWASFSAPPLTNFPHLLWSLLHPQPWCFKKWRGGGVGVGVGKGKGREKTRTEGGEMSVGLRLKGDRKWEKQI